MLYGQLLQNTKLPVFSRIRRGWSVTQLVLAGFYIPIIRIAVIKGGMTIPNIRSWPTQTRFLQNTGGTPWTELASCIWSLWFSRMRFQETCQLAFSISNCTSKYRFFFSCFLTHEFTPKPSWGWIWTFQCWGYHIPMTDPWDERYICLHFP